MRLSRSNWMLLGGWALLVAVSGRAVIWPAHRASIELDADISAKKAELARPGSGPETIERLARELTALRNLGKARMTPIPEESGVAGLVRELSNSFDGLGLIDREVSTGAAKQLEEASAMPMTVALAGDFPSIYRAVAQIENLDRLVRVQRLRVSLENRAGKEGADRTGRVRAEVLLDIFYEPRSIKTVHADQGQEQSQ